MTSKHTILASFIGYITQAIVNNLAPLLFSIFMVQFGLNTKQIAFLGSMNFIVQLTTDYVAAKKVDEWGYRPSIISAHVFCALGLVGLSLFPVLFKNDYFALLFAVCLYAVGGGLIEVLISPIVEACPTKNKASIMSLLHSFYCWGCVLVIGASSLYFFLFGKQLWMYLPLIWAVIPIFNALFFSKVPLFDFVSEGEAVPFSRLVQNKCFVLLLAMMICAGASEHAMAQWASSFVELSLGLSKSVGDLLGPCFFAVMMGLSRVFYASQGEKIDLIKYIQLSCILGILSFVFASIPNQPFFNLLACGGCGLSVGILWPGIFSVASSTFKQGGTTMFAFLALSGDVGCALGPYIIGIMGNMSLQKGLMFGLVFPLSLIILCRAYKKLSA